MNKLCIGADGHTYDRKAIEEWSEEQRYFTVYKLANSKQDSTSKLSLLSAIIERKMLTKGSY